MQYAIDCLVAERERMLSLIKDGNSRLIPNKIELEKAISWLSKLEELRLERSAEYQFIKLPDMQTGYSEYRVMNDCESGNIYDWIGLVDDDSYPITLIPGDILLSKGSHYNITSFKSEDDY